MNEWIIEDRLHSDFCTQSFYLYSFSVYQADNWYPDTNWLAKAVHLNSLNFSCNWNLKKTNKQETQEKYSSLKRVAWKMLKIE